MSMGEREAHGAERNACLGTEDGEVEEEGTADDDDNRQEGKAVKLQA